MRNNLHLSIAALFAVASAQVFARDTGWTNHIEQMAFLEGDAHGTVCHDVYVEHDNPTVNNNGQGLSLRYSQALAGGDRRPGFIRFEGIEALLPEDAFVIEAFLQLTANAQSTVDLTGWQKYTQGALVIAARGHTFDEATATWNTMPGSVNSFALGGRDQVWSHAFQDQLASNGVVRANVTPSVRAWLDHHRNAGHGYANQGFSMNIDPDWANNPSGTVSFFDSEAENAANRPQLVFRYLRPSSGYRAYLFQPVAQATSHVVPVAVQDAMIRRSNQNSGWPNDHTSNYGGMMGSYAITGLDPSAMLFRWADLALPVDHPLVDARLRINGLSGWALATSETGSWQVRQVHRPWVEGTGVVSWATSSSTSKAGVTWTNYNAVVGDPAQNLWTGAGGLGAGDSTSLFNLGCRTRDGEVLATDSGDALLEVVRGWLDGGDNDGLMVRATADPRVSLYFAKLGSAHNDPYLSPGLLLIVKPQAVSVFLVR